MPSPRECVGVVESGRGLGATRLADTEFLAQFGALAGFPIVPGTLNVRLSAPFERQPTMGYLAADQIDPNFEAETGQAGLFFAPVIIAGRYRGVAIQAVEAGHPEDQVELICEVHLRSTLGLVDGDRISFTPVEVRDRR